VPPWAIPVELEIDLATVDRAVTGLRVLGGTSTLDAGHTAELLRGLRGGTHVPKLAMDVVAFRQLAAANRNFVRFPLPVLEDLAPTYGGVPFLRDHQQRNLDARGGTVVASKLDLSEAAGPRFLQSIELAAPWAVEKALLGLLDRFSIGWHTTGELLCSVCQTPLLAGDCYHMPGDSVDGMRVEAIVTGAVGAETSAVNVPAVSGTGIESIRAAFASRLAARPTLVPVLLPPKEQPMQRLTALAAAVGLADDATEDGILAAVEKLKGEQAKLGSLLEAERTAHAQARARVGELEGELGRLETDRREAAIDALIARARGKVGQKIGEDKKPVRGGTPFERVILATAPRSLEEATAYVDELPQIVPSGLESKPTASELGERTRQDRAQAKILDGQLGLSDDDFARFAPRRQ